MNDDYSTTGNPQPVGNCPAAQPAAEPTGEESVCQCGVSWSVHSFNEGHSFTPANCEDLTRITRTLWLDGVLLGTLEER